MASIVKRKNRYSVVYTYTDESGAKRQKWETFATNAEAKKRKKQIEFEQDTGTFILPTAKTVSDLLEEYMSIYGVNTWAMSTYEARRSLIFNYINPLIGDLKLDDITPRTMDKFYQSLLTVKAKVVNNRKPNNEYLTAHTVREIHKLLRNAFNQDHVHMLVSIPPKLSVAQFMGYLKGKSSLMIFDRHANLKYKYGNRHFWCRGYYVDTVGRNKKVIEEYIKNQLQEDIANDQMSLKEFIDPFTGDKVK